MEYVSLSNLRFGDGELENSETIYIYYTIIQYEYGG